MTEKIHQITHRFIYHVALVTKKWLSQQKFDEKDIEMKIPDQ